ncbi:Xaa-Pro peptidase family protein [Ensifer sp. Root127]|uniref:M24 family metallopeptidase n=1 Tax=Ensifer sp. Root127 TaxID=1736440 RepID=UPI0007111801|nr:Xaa-Pro peptidase family protein [Ensifer sp. Root127]KQW61411.1 peptidase M24 [Ensifer sp. Root127]
MLLNLSRLERNMDAEGLDAVIATGAENVTYLSGFWALPQWIRPGPQAYAVWPRADAETRSSVITSSGTLDLIADQNVWAARVARYGEFAVEVGADVENDLTSRRLAEMQSLREHASPVEALAAELEELGLRKARIGLDLSGLSPGYLEQLSAKCPHASFIDAQPLFRSTRSVKSPSEIERLRRVGKVAEISVEAALAVARAGITEIEMARVFHEKTVREDTLPILGCIGFGERSALMNVQPSQRSLRPDDIIRFDVGGRYQHYRADIARIASFGEPSSGLRSQYAALRAGVEHGASIVRPGLSASELFGEIMRAVQDAGLDRYRRNHVGHGIGLDGYDAPLLAPGSKDVLEEGMVLCIETPFYMIGSYGLQVEDMFVVTGQGAERLTSSGDIKVIAP